VASDKPLTRTQRILDFVVDCIWPRARRLSWPSAEPEWPDSIASHSETLEVVYEALKEEHQAEADRIRTVETKLLGISGLSPLAMAVVVGAFTVLTNGNLRSFTRSSVLVVGVVEGYVTLQLLRAILSAIAGLKRRSFYTSSLADLYPVPNEDKASYLSRMCKELASIIRGNRSEIDAKVTWLDVAHTAIRNAVIGLLILVVVIMVLAVHQSTP
jgi:hypothetical protein